MNFLGQGFQSRSITDRQTDTQTDATENTTAPHSRVVIEHNVCLSMKTAEYYKTYLVLQTEEQRPHLPPCLPQTVLPSSNLNISAPTLSSFRRRLKLFLFQQSYPDIVI